MDVSIIIVNFNTKNLIKQCIKSILINTKDVDFEIIVVDNNSNDGSQEMIKSEFKNILLIENKENYGFGKANNIGIKASKGKYIFLLNSDTILLNNAVKIFFDWMEDNPNTAVVGCYLLNKYYVRTHSYGKLPTIINTIWDEINVFQRISGKNFEYYEPEINKEVEYITGADLFIRKDILDKFGLFDENYFMYCEESDLIKRIKENGYKVEIIKGPRIIHLEGQSIKVSNNKRILQDESKLIFLSKYSSKLKFILFYYLFIILKKIKLVINKKYTKEENKLYFEKLKKTMNCLLRGRIEREIN